ncbi:uncharacterized protein LOC126989765 [Eriocheir sinensis]|uniref:uncharacterized protein LOC126989765 n=1 Tax=Eriocheir sinensis TaxID=95602 RepID=UPI0021C7C98E|nr:uncharacterized protein LOC126989765 [Eriocheir sinensis]
MKGRGGVVGRLHEDHPVTIEYNERCGVMKLRGLADDVRRCQDDIDGTIKTWQRENSKKQMTKKAAANGAKSEGKETTPRQDTKPVRAPDTRQDQARKETNAATTGAKNEGKEVTTPRQDTKPVRAPDTRQDQAREQRKAGTRSVCAPDTRQDQAREQRKAGTRSVCAPNTRQGTERVCAPITRQGTERVCAPNTRQGTERVCAPNTRQGTERVCAPNTRRTATAIRNAPSPQDTRPEARQHPPAADGAPKERQRKVAKEAVKGRSKGIAKGPSQEAPKGASHDTPEGAPREAQPWTLLPPPRLRSPDRRDILGQRWLSDDVMDLAQELLQRQFPNTRGLYASGAAFTLPPLQPGSGALFLQVVNRSTPMSLASMADYGRTGGSHWLLLSSYGAARPGQLAVYDSLYDTLSASTAALVRQLQELHTPPPDTVMRPVQRQRDGYSCGLFALAFAFSIAHGQDPCRVRYVRARMARHLLACLERGTVTPFPSEPKDTMG